jgi:hypothetical protein
MHDPIDSYNAEQFRTSNNFSGSCSSRQDLEGNEEDGLVLSMVSEDTISISH